jgi:hypothetical protein
MDGRASFPLFDAGNLAPTTSIIIKKEFDWKDREACRSECQRQHQSLDAPRFVIVCTIGSKPHDTSSDFPSQICKNVLAPPERPLHNPVILRRVRPEVPALQDLFPFRDFLIPAKQRSPYNGAPLHPDQIAKQAPKFFLQWLQTIETRNDVLARKLLGLNEETNGAPPAAFAINGRGA